jgi:hypothetical protein
VSTPPANVPTVPSRRWHRGNFSGVRVPGFTNGYNAGDRSLVMTWELPTWSAEDQNLILHHYAGVCGYTHIILSIPQAKNWNVSLDQLIACAIRVSTPVVHEGWP